MKFEDFTNLYPVNKTLRFQLKPMGETEDNINKKGLLKEDEVLAEDYKKAKKIIDEYHKDFINSRLKNFSFAQTELENFSKEYQQYKNKQSDGKKLNELQDRMRKKIADILRSKELFDKKFIKEILPQWLEKNKINLEGIENPKEIILSFKERTTYFQGFYENRKNIYTNRPHSTSIGYRLIHENLPRFLENINRYKKAKELGVEFSEIENNFKIKLDDVFTIKAFDQVLTQEGIEEYNKIRGGLSLEDNEKQKGINEIINLYSQGSELTDGQRKNIRRCQLEELYKQILSDREEVSFRLDEISSDADLCEKIKSLYCVDKNGDVVGKGFNITKMFDNVLSSIESAKQENIYIKNSSVGHISHQIFGNWNQIQHCLEYYAEKKLFPSQNGKETKKIKDVREKWAKGLYFSFSDIHKALEFYSVQSGDEEFQEENAKVNINEVLFNFFKRKIVKRKNDKGILEEKEILKEIQESYEDAVLILQEYNEVNKEELKNKESKVLTIKRFLDSLKELQGFLRPLQVDFKDQQKEKMGLEIYEKDGGFYSEFEELYRYVSQIIPLYNQVRNYLTKKRYSVEKYKLNFENQTLADGWDKNKEKDNSCVFLFKDERYFLGIIDREHKKIFEGPIPKNGSCYQKMDYKFLPGANKMLVKVFFPKKDIQKYNPSKKIHKIRNHSSFTKNGKPQEGFEKKPFNLEDMQDMIDFFKDSISKHEDWSQFKFKFSDTKKYKDISEFYREVEEQGYKISFQNVSQEYVGQCIEKGQLYLFEVYSKDFSPKTRGTPNLQTLYWKELFSDENLRDVIYKLDGRAELFYRKKSLNYSKEIWEKGHHLNDPKKKQKYAIIKDRRYAENTFLFHVPITSNFKSKRGKANKLINEGVKEYIKNNQGINIIGLDRGERNLVYFSVINAKGKILDQGKLHVFNEKDYHELLDKKEKERTKARESWATIGKIKDLKEGYLSQVVHKIVSLMIEHRAIIVLEDLNFGFKRGRFKIEKQVYQKLEKKLIDKLNYLVLKTKGGRRTDRDEIGGVAKALQLTAPFESFQKLGKQTGFMFYVPAHYTSKICPETGFVNLLYPKYESIEKSKDFFKRFDKICFNPSENYFEFHFNYENFPTKYGLGINWVACSHGERLEWNKNSNKTDTINLKKEMEELFKKYNIEFSQGKCLKDKILKRVEKDFFKQLIRYFKLTLQMRNSNSSTGEDWIISPVRNHKGSFFDSRNVDNSNPKQPKDADANGAYHVALKGLLMVKQINQDKEQDLKSETWLQFVQKRKW